MAGSSRRRINPLFSLRTQLVFGSMALLALAVGSVSYSLVVQQKRMLTNEIEKTIVYQGRNIALSCQTDLLRSDPGFELFPRVKRILSQSANITDVVITDSDGMIQGDRVVANWAKPYKPEISGYTLRRSAMLVADERLYDSRDTFLFSTPVSNAGKEIGRVHLGYSKIDLHRSTRQAITITFVCGAIAFGLAIILALLVVKRISRPLEVLVRGAERMGSGDLDTRITLRTKNEFSALAESVNEMAARISQAQTELVSKERMDRELEIAHDIQNSLVPTESYKTGRFEVSFYYKAAAEVGGDYVDAFPIDDTNLAMVMGDVSGKGVPGLVVMAMLKVMVRDLVNKGLTPKEVVQKLNVMLADNLKPKMFVTLFIAYLNRDTGELTYSNAGHNPLMIYNRAANTCELQKLGGTPIGVLPDNLFEPLLSEHRLRLDPGDLIFQYTDGLNESQDTSGARFGFDKVVQAGRSFAKSGAMGFVQQMIVSEETFRLGAMQQDDITLLALSCQESVAAGRSSDLRFAPGAEDISILVHSIDFDKDVVLLDVVGPITRQQQDILEQLVSVCDKIGIGKIRIRRAPDLPEDALTVLTSLAASHPSIFLENLCDDEQRWTGDALYRRSSLSPSDAPAVEYVIRLPEFASALHRINQVVLLIGSSIPLDQKCMSHLEFCIHELVANSVEHAAFTTRKPEIEVVLTPKADAVDVTYRDNAEPFQPSERLEVDISHRIQEGKKRGFGIYLIHQFTEEFKHEREHEWNNTMFRIKRDTELQEV